MVTFCLEIAYEGTRYNGWQRQGNTDKTIQGKIEHVLSELACHKIEVHGAGRTDAGVHARAQIASFRMETDLTANEIGTYCNRYLPEDIAILSCTKAEERFHARLNAKGKRYIYRVWNSGVPNVFERKFLTTLPETLSLEAMRQGAAKCIGQHDFRAFSANKHQKKSTVRTLQSIDIERIGEELRFTYVGSGFLYNMVRILTGTLIEIGLGEREIGAIDLAFATLDRGTVGRTMPPQGLILDKVFY